MKWVRSETRGDKRERRRMERWQGCGSEGRRRMEEENADVLSWVKNNRGNLSVRWDGQGEEGILEERVGG